MITKIGFSPVFYGRKRKEAAEIQNNRPNDKNSKLLSEIANNYTVTKNDEDKAILINIFTGKKCEITPSYKFIKSDCFLGSIFEISALKIKRELDNGRIAENTINADGKNKKAFSQLVSACQFCSDTPEVKVKSLYADKINYQKHKK